MKTYHFKLYITGETRHSQMAVDNLKRLCDEFLQGDCTTNVLDVLRNPEQAEADRIIATPTLIRLLPLPQRRVIGDLSNLHAVIVTLGLHNP